MWPANGDCGRLVENVRMGAPGMVVVEASVVCAATVGQRISMVRRSTFRKA
jgi:hypothetical protein